MDRSGEYIALSSQEAEVLVELADLVPLPAPLTDQVLNELEKRESDERLDLTDLSLPIADIKPLIPRIGWLALDGDYDIFGYTLQREYLIFELSGNSDKLTAAYVKEEARKYQDFLNKLCLALND